MRNLLNHKRISIVSTEITEILLKGRKIASHPSIHRTNAEEEGEGLDAVKLV